MSARNSQRGGALVEFAMILPLALVFLIGIIQFGIVMFEYHATSYAAKFGARWASVHGSDCTGSGCPTTTAAIQTVIRKEIPGAGSATILATWASPNPTTYAGTSGGLNTCNGTHQGKGCFVTVTVTNVVGLDIPFITRKRVTFTATSFQPIPQ